MLRVVAVVPPAMLLKQVGRAVHWQKNREMGRVQPELRMKAVSASFTLLAALCYVGHCHPCAKK